MEDFSAWEAILKLLNKAEYMGVVYEYDDGYKSFICPICKKREGHGHYSGCELENAKSIISSMLYS